MSMMKALSIFQKELILGSLLGDGMLGKIKGHGNSRFSEGHSLSQEPYLKWKADILGVPLTYGSSPARKKVGGVIINDQSSVCYWCRLRTSVSRELTELEWQWYRRDKNGEYILDSNGWRVKCVPANLIISPFMLYVWYLDDGENVPQQRRAIINTQSFAESEVEYLVSQIVSMGHECKKSPSHGKFVILIKAKGYENFINHMQTFATPECLKYKTDLGDYIARHQGRWEPTTPQMISEISRMRYIDRLTLEEIGQQKQMCFQQISHILKSTETYQNIRIESKRTGGVNGIRKRGKRYQVSIGVNGETIYLGTCESAIAAKKLRIQAEELRKNQVVDEAAYHNLAGGNYGSL